MTADRLKKNGFGAFVFNEAEYDTKIIAGAAGPGPFELSLELVGTKLGIMGVFPEKLHRDPEILDQ